MRSLDTVRLHRLLRSIAVSPIAPAGGRAASSSSSSYCAVPPLPSGLGRPARAVYISGSGLIPVTRGGGASLASLGGAAIAAALADAAQPAAGVGALYCGNMMAGQLSSQQHIGALLAGAGGLTGVEAATAEACCGAGGAALRWGYLAVASGAVDVAVVAGVEAMTHVPAAAATAALATASDRAREGAAGATFVSLNGDMMRAYMAAYGVPHAAFAPFAVAAHGNAARAGAAHAVLRKGGVDAAAYEASRVIVDPIRLLDASPLCDGAAAIVLTADAGAAAAGAGGARVRLAGCAAATDDLAVAARADALYLRAVARSTDVALALAGLARADVDIFELHDAYAIMACLSLESAGFAPRGQGAAWAAGGTIELGGALPIATFGGLKARGHPVGATGVYQAAEMHRQLTRRAGDNQVGGAEVALTQNIGGSGASVFTAAFVRE